MADRSAVLDHLEEVAGETRLLDPVERVEVLDVAVSRLQAAQASALRDLEAHGRLEGSGCRTIGSWARLHLRRDHSAFRATRRARLLPELPGFDAAFAAGEVTDEHVDTLLRWVKPCGITTVQANEGTLVTLARRASPRELGQALELLADLTDPDRDEDRVAALAGRSFKASAVGDLVHVDAMVEPALGEALKTTVEAMAAPTGRGVRPASGQDDRTLLQRRADAFGEIVLSGIAGRTTTGAGQDDATTKDQGGGHGGGRGRSDTGRLRPQIAVTVTLAELRGVEGAPKALLDHFGVIPTATTRRLTCDGDLTRVILDTVTGLPLAVGRRHRLAVKRQRRALATIFRHCVFPGCTAPFRFCEIHHRDWWCRDGGNTDLDVLLPYCWTHHHFVHEYGFTVTHETAHGTDRLIHRRPDGSALPDPEPPLRQALTQLRLDLRPRGTFSDEARDPPPADEAGCDVLGHG